MPLGDQLAEGETIGLSRMRGAFFVEIGLLKADPTQPRKAFSAEKQAELTASVLRRGIRQPIRVRKDASDGKYWIVAGEWEPLERKVTLGVDPDLTQVRWTLHDEQGRLIDCSENLSGDSTIQLDGTSSKWRTFVRQINAGQLVTEHPNMHPAPLALTAIAELPKDRTATRLRFVLTAALSEEPVHAALSNLVIAMGLVSLLTWGTAAVWGRWLSKRALSPITQMAAKARILQQLPESRELLEVSPNGDELTDLGQAFNQLLVTLRDNIERQQRFAGDASHQLRTPLAAMLTAVDVAARHERSPEEYQRILAVVQRRGRDLQQIVEILLALARRSPGSEALESERVELNAWCRERVELWQAHPRSGDFELQLCSTDLLVQVQPSLLGQVVDNLLDNACKYSDAGSAITIRTMANTAEAIIRIEDRGPGIPANELTDIFEPFFRSANARQLGQPGSGLGLTLAQRLAAVFSARVEVESIEGQGSSFQVVLPRVFALGPPVPEPLQTSSSVQPS